MLQDCESSEIWGKNEVRLITKSNESDNTLKKPIWRLEKTNAMEGCERKEEWKRGDKFRGIC